MQKFWRTVRPFLLLSLLGAVLVVPLTGLEVPCTDDGQLYYYQSAAMQHQLQRGLIYSRWLPDVALGYGLPFFNYREPLPRFLVLGPVVAGLPTPLALNLVHAALIIFTGWGAYLLTRDVFDDETAGLIAGVAAMAAPYVLLDAYRRGNLPESVALALIPWVLWAFWQSAYSRRRALAAIAAALLWAALILSHNISTLLFAPFLFAYVVMLNLAREDTSRTPLRSAPVLAFLDGLGISAFYWIPALFETDLIQLSKAVTTRNNRYDFNFLPASEVFALPQPENPALLNPPLTIPLGTLLLIFAIVGALAGWFAYRRYVQRAHIVLFAGAAVCYLLLVFPFSKPLWDVLPLVSFVQFPWRLVGRSAVLLAPLAGLSVSAVMHLLKIRWPGTNLGWLSVLLGVWVAVMLLIEGLAGTYPAYCRYENPYPTILDVNRFEQDRLIGLDNEASYFPVGVQPPEDSPLLVDYANGSPPNRFDPRRVPSTATVSIRYKPLGADINVTTPEAFTARYLTYVFPGWYVRIDGILVQPTADESGLITFNVPAGTHDIDIRFGPTPLRGLALAISAVSLLGLLVDVYPKLNFDDTPKPKSTVSTTQPHVVRGTHTLLWIGLTAAASILIGVRLFVPFAVPLPWRFDRLPSPQIPLNISYNGQVELIGADVEQGTWRADNFKRVDTYWRRTAELPPVEAGVALRVLDENDVNWALPDGTPPRGTKDPDLAIHQWPMGAFAMNSQLVELVPGTPPGTYTLAVTLFQLDTFVPFTATAPQSARRVQVPAQAVNVAWPQTMWAVSQLDIQFALHEEVAPGLTLLGYNIDRDEASPGETALITLFWQANAPGEGLPPLALQFGGEQVPLEWQVEGAVPSGAVWRQQHPVRVPASVSSGQQPVNLIAGESDVSLGSIAIPEIARVFDIPPTQYITTSAFGQSADILLLRLEGVNVASVDGGIRASLIWSALADIPGEYTVFVHALDTNGSIIVQSDSVPSAGARPTSSWVPGEVILDNHRLATSLDAISALRVGIYDSATGVRLQVDEGGDSVLIPLAP